MQKLFEECEQIYKTKYLIDGDTMIATTLVLQQLQRNLEIVEIHDSRVSYKIIVNGPHALFASSVAYKSDKTRRDAFDTNKICTTIGNATRTIRRFFNQERFRDFVFALNLGNTAHDMAVFVRKSNGTYHLVHFNPNEQTVSRTMNAFEKSLGRKTTRMGYHPKSGNPNGICSYLTWMELLRFILMNKNPFIIENLLVYNKVNKTYCTNDELVKFRLEYNKKVNKSYHEKKSKVKK